MKLSIEVVPYKVSLIADTECIVDRIQCTIAPLKNCPLRHLQPTSFAGFAVCFKTHHKTHSPVSPHFRCILIDNATSAQGILAYPNSKGIGSIITKLYSWDDF